MKNLWELGTIHFPYIVPVILHSLPEELIRGEHFILADLLRSISGSSSQAKSTKETQAESPEGASVSFAQPDQTPLAVQEQESAPRSVKKKGKKKKGRITTGEVKAVDVGLEGFVDWLDPLDSDPTKEREEDMSSLATGFAARMRKQAVSAQREITRDSIIYGERHPKRSGPDEEAQKSPSVIIMDSQE